VLERTATVAGGIEARIRTQSARLSSADPGGSSGSVEFVSVAACGSSAAEGVGGLSGTKASPRACQPTCNWLRYSRANATRSIRSLRHPHVVISSAPGITTLLLPGEPIVQLNQNDMGIFVDRPGLLVGSVSLHLNPSAGTALAPTSLDYAGASVLSGQFIILYGLGQNTQGHFAFNAGPSNTGWFLLGNFTAAHLTPCAPGTCAAVNGVYEDFAALGPTVLNDNLTTAITSDFRIVPEPSSLLPLGLAATALAGIRRVARDHA